MSDQVVKTPILIYTEETPNPESLKFVVNKMLYPGGTADFRTVEDAQKWSPMATEIFGFPYVSGVYICNNFVSVTKDPLYTWKDIQHELKGFIKNYVMDGLPVVDPGYKEEQDRLEAEKHAREYTGDDVAIVQKIKDLIENVVKPAVANDGGNIEFHSFNKGVVTVILQGSCSGCPSSTITLKAGIEAMLKRMVPEVTEVISEMG